MAEKKSVGVKILQKGKVLTNKKGEESVYLEFAEVTNIDGTVFSTPNIKPDSPFAPHPDLIKALKALVPHWAIAAEFMDAKKFNKAYFDGKKYLDDNNLSSYLVTGIKIYEKSKHEHVIIFGRKILSTGRVINDSPSFNLESTDENGYIFLDQLRSAVDLVREEFGLYESEGKYAPDKQMKLFPNQMPKHEEGGEQEPGKKAKAG